MPICHRLSRGSSKNWIESQLQYKRFGVINGYYYVTLPMCFARQSHSTASHYQSWCTNLCYAYACKNEVGFGYGWIELGLNLLHDLNKCNSTSNFSSISGFRKSANSNLI